MRNPTVDYAFEELRRLNWEVLDFNNAIDVSKKLFEKEISNLCEILIETKVDLENDIITGGGGKSLFVQDLEKKLKNQKWKKNNISVTNKISFLNDIQDIETESSSHEVDHLIKTEKENLAILEIEWNNKSEFFDRDLHNIQNAWQIHAVELGIIITRSKALNENLTNDIYSYFIENKINEYSDFDRLKEKLIRFTFPSTSHKKTIDKAMLDNKDFTKTAAEVFWASKYRKTTFSDELVKRINRGQLGRAPLIIFGIPPISGT